MPVLLIILEAGQTIEYPLETSHYSPDQTLRLRWIYSLTKDLKAERYAEWICRPDR